MSDLSATREIAALSTQNGSYYVGESFGYYSRITTTEKNGVIWYQLWHNGQVIKEVNSQLVIDIDYEPL